MFHQACIVNVVSPQLGQVVGEFLPVLEQLGKAGQAGIHRIAVDMDNLRIGQHQVDQADRQKIRRHLVGDAPRIRRAPLQTGHIFRAPGSEPGLIERVQVVRKNRACNIVP